MKLFILKNVATDTHVQKAFKESGAGGVQGLSGGAGVVDQRLEALLPHFLAARQELFNIPEQKVPITLQTEIWSIAMSVPFIATIT